MPNVEPNQYSMQAHHLKITYKTDGFQGQPTFHYEDGKQTKDFRGSDIRVQQTEIGQLVTVTLLITVDTGSTSFSVLIPPVVLSSNSDQEQFHTLGIQTQHKTALVLPPTGPRDTYEVHTLKGIAARVIVPLGASGQS
jgi:hypothetical protein